VVGNGKEKNQKKKKKEKEIGIIPYLLFLIGGDKMIRKGFSIPIKKALGTIMAMVSLGLLFYPEPFSDYLIKFRPAFAILFGIVAYYLLIAGRRR